MWDLVPWPVTPCFGSMESLATGPSWKSPVDLLSFRAHRTHWCRCYSPQFVDEKLRLSEAKSLSKFLQLERDSPDFSLYRQGSLKEPLALFEHVIWSCDAPPSTESLPLYAEMWHMLCWFHWETVLSPSSKPETQPGAFLLGNCPESFRPHWKRCVNPTQKKRASGDCQSVSWENSTEGSKGWLWALSKSHILWANVPLEIGSQRQKGHLKVPGGSFEIPDLHRWIPPDPSCEHPKLALTWSYEMS